MPVHVRVQATERCYHPALLRSKYREKTGKLKKNRGPVSTNGGNWKKWLQSHDGVKETSRNTHFRCKSVYLTRAYSYSDRVIVSIHKKDANTRESAQFLKFSRKVRSLTVFAFIRVHLQTDQDMHLFLVCFFAAAIKRRSLRVAGNQDVFVTTNDA